MATRTHLSELACEIAELAATTTDAATATKLTDLADRLLTEAGLPEGGSGERPPGDWSHVARVDDIEWA